MKRSEPSIQTWWKNATGRVGEYSASPQRWVVEALQLSPCVRPTASRYAEEEGHWNHHRGNRSPLDGCESKEMILRHVT